MIFKHDCQAKKIKMQIVRQITQIKALFYSLTFFKLFYFSEMSFKKTKENYEMFVSKNTLF